MYRRPLGFVVTDDWLHTALQWHSAAQNQILEVTTLNHSKTLRADFKQHWKIYLLALPVMVYFVVFHYVPMAGLVMAFEDFAPRLGVFRSDWVGLKNFETFFNSYYCVRLIRNTFLISFYDLLFGFPIAIVLALMLNEVHNQRFKKTIQTVSYMPYFISTVVVAGILIDFCKTNGALNDIVRLFGGERVNLLGDPKLFRTIYVGSDIWQRMGYNSIIYMAALSGIEQTLYEAAVIDGAGRWRQTWHVTLPGIASTIIITLILRIGSIMNVGFEKIILLYSPSTYETADIISSFAYRKGLIDADYGYSTAIGLFNSAVNFVLILGANALSKKYSETSLF